VALPYAPAEKTPRPRIPGPQTAVVVGPAGEEIFTDKYSRVKVQFPWDRDGKNDAASSCWVRVGTLWAGTQWGAIHIPRIGQEVIVAFEDGDPDRPIIVGSVYNADNMPPYTLPDNRTQSGVKSRSSLKGTAENFNELRFEDKKDSEEIYFHAEKNFNRVVENNDTLKVGFLKKDKGDRTVEVFNNESISIGGGKGEAADGSQTVDIFNNQKLTVGSGKGNAKDGSQTITVYKNRTTLIETGDETLTVDKGKRTEEVEGNDTLTVRTGNRAVTIKTGNDDLTVSSGNLTIKVSAGTASVEAAQKIELKCGGSTITMEPAKITIKSPMVTVQGDAKVDVKSPMTTVTGDGVLTLKGGVVLIN
jgi:type VI secretion system secreted protein VgrG